MVHQSNMSEWKHVLTLEKSEYSDEGPWYIEGVVAGPGYVDAAGDEFLPQALKQVAAHINEFGLPLMDWHGLGHKNTIMDAEMGEISKAWFDDEGLLHVAGELDKSVPTSQWLRTKTDPKLLPEGKEPKKFGLSLHGVAQNVRRVFEGGRVKQLIADTIPDEISLTTRPFFQPSLGTVISKAIDEAAEAELNATGDKSSMSDEVTPQAVEQDTDSQVVEDAAEQAGVDTTPDSETVEDAAASTDNVTVEKSEDERIAEMTASLTDAIRNIVRQEIGNSKVEPVAPDAASTPAEVVVEKSESEKIDDRLTIIEKAMLGLSANLERVLETVPETRAPGVLIAKSQDEELRDTFAQMSPSERIRAGFQLSEQKLR